MKIIVTGCKGQLGTEIIKQLREGRSFDGAVYLSVGGASTYWRIYR